MNNPGYRKEQIYLDRGERIDQYTMQSIKDAIAMNNAVGTLIGRYDEQLTILSVSDYLLTTLDYSYEEFQTVSQQSLKKIFCEESQYWQIGRAHV